MPSSDLPHDSTPRDDAPSHEVSERRKAEAALRDNEERYRNIFDAMDEGFCDIEVVFDGADQPVDYIFWETNRAFERHCGLSDVIGKSMRQMVPEHDHIWFETYGNVAKTGVPIHLESEAIALGRWFDVNASRIGGPGSHRVAVLFNDITERKHAERRIQQMAEANAKFRTMFEQGMQFAGLLSVDGTVVEANRLAVDTCGFVREEVIGRPFWECGWWNRDPVLVQRIKAASLAAAAGELFRTETHYYVADGSQRFVDLTIAPVKDDEGHVLFVAPTGNDITARYEAEEALRISEDRGRLALESAELGAWHIDPATNTLESDERFRMIFGATRAPLTYEQAFGLIHSDDRDRVRRAVEAATRVDNPEPYAAEYRVVHPDGSVHWVFGKGRANFADEGPAKRLVSFDGTVADITERKRIEQELRESEERFRHMADNAPVMVWITDPAGVCSYLSASWYAYTGQTPEVGLGFGWLNAVHPEDRETAQREFIASNARHAAYHVEFRLRRADGEYRWFIDAAVPRNDQDGRFLGFIGSVTDITDLKQAEEWVRESRARLQFSLEAAQIGDWDLDLVTDESRRSLRHDQCFGYDQPVEHWGLGTYLQHVHPDDRSRVEKLFYEAIAQQKDWRFECRVLWPDQSEHWIALHGSIYRSAGGEPTHMLGIVANIDERKWMENQLRQNAAELSDADHRKNEFLAMLAHELRNPLAPIRNALQIVRLSGGNIELIQSASEVMERQISQMVRLVDDLLDISRITRNKMELRRKRVELSTIIYQAVETSRPAIERAQHELTVTMPPEPIYLDADLVRLAQTFSNLLNNACKYSEPNGHIWLCVTRLETEVTVSIKDSGVGIPADMLPRIFEMFTQVDRSLERSQGGLGIGLTLVRRLVEMHGGNVQAFSEGPGCGSEFVVRLPIASSSSIQDPAEITSREPARTGGLRILVVDDNADSATSLATLLRLSGNQTHVVYDGLAAVEATMTYKPDLVLLDIGLPKLNGYEAARRMREQPGGKNMVIVALTGWGQEEDRRKTQEAGFNGHLVKPVHHAALHKKLADIMPQRF